MGDRLSARLVAEIAPASTIAGLGQGIRKKGGDEMTNRIVRLMFACMALACSSPLLAAQASNMAPCAPNATHDVQTLEGFLVVRVECSDVLLEIPVPMLNRSILLYTEFAALSTGGSEYAPGSAINSRIVRWARFGNKVALLTICTGAICSARM
jgi:hypothetical protein